MRHSEGSLSATPSATIAGSMTTISSVDDVAVDASEKIYVVDQNTPMAVKVFAANPSGVTNEAPIAQITGSHVSEPRPRLRPAPPFLARTGNALPRKAVVSAYQALRRESVGCAVAVSSGTAV
jgi:hypothetical protein